MENVDQKALHARFIQEAQALSCHLHQVSDEIAAAQTVLQLLKADKRVTAWDFEQIPCPSLSKSLHEAEIAVAPFGDPSIRVGITGASAALAATGSLVMVSRPGCYRSTSLLPPFHIAIITQDQILPDMESWLAQERQKNLGSFQAANINIISGPSRTADIAMELILGMHGPGALHIIIIATEKSAQE
jgi:L-lactate dehydrogenase complex protein LldG